MADDKMQTPKGLTKRNYVMQRLGAMRLERSSWISHWTEISRYQQPRLGRFFVTDRNRGEKRHQSIYDRTALGAQRTLAAGLMSGVTSPARPWFKLTLANRQLMEVGSVKSWLFRTENLLREIFNHSNVYRSLHTLYGELGLFGTACAVVVADFDNVIHLYPLTIGEYMLGVDHKGRVSSMAREFQLTVEQVYDQFGAENCSQTVCDLYKRGELTQWITVVHLIEPNRNYDPSKRDAKRMRWSSVYMELGGSGDTMLGVAGFRRFSVLAPRWEVTSGDVYGSSPGMEALGDVKQLQHEQLRKAQAIDYMVNPPLQVPASYKDNPKARLPAGLMYVDSAGSGSAIKTAYDVNIDLNALREDIVDVRQRVLQAYYADLFMMLANDTRSGVTATEIAERHEEKMLMIGPVLERLHNELLEPLIDLTFDYAAEAGILPPVPPELEGMELSVEFISTLAQAQRILSAQGMDRLFGTVAKLSALDPNAVLKVDIAQAIDDYGTLYSVNPEVVVPDDVYQARVDARAKQQAQIQQQAIASQKAVDAKNLAAAGVPQASPDVMNGLQGYTTPGVLQ